MGIFNELLYKYKSGSLLIKLIFINVGVFVVLKLALLILMLLGIDNSLVGMLVELPSTWSGVLSRPWTLFTYMFMHGDVFHILFNMLCLYWVGMVFMEFNTPKQMVALYMLSGLGGALLYLVAHNTLPYFAGAYSTLVGASASVLGIMVAVGVRAPNYRIGMMFLGPVPMKWIVLSIVVIDLLSLGGANTGGHVAHIGGVLVGALYAVLMKHGFDMTKGLNRTIDYLVDLFEKKPKGPGKPIGGTKYHYAEPEKEPQKAKKSSSVRDQFVSPEEAAIDEILEKIKVSGYASLTAEEKQRIFSAGNKNTKH